MKARLIPLLAALACAWAGSAVAQAQTREAHNAHKDRIEAEYKAAKQRCAALKDNAKDVCEAEAKGNHKVARAELEHLRQPNAAHAEKLQIARAEAAYELAKEKCDDLSGNQEDVCEKDAKAAFEAGKAQAKSARAAATPGG